jgi:hypothetical protein
MITLLLIYGCANPVPQAGSPFHPETDLKCLSDGELQNYYIFSCDIIENQERDLEILESGTAGLAYSLSFDKNECRERMEKNKSAKNRLYTEIIRRGLIPKSNPEFNHRMEPMISFGVNNFSVPKLGIRDLIVW